MLVRIACWGVVLMGFASLAGGQESAPTKTRGVLYPTDLTVKAQANAAAYPWAAAMQKDLVDLAAPWLAMSDDDLWNAMFGPNITRSWMVWSDGYCPACKKDVKMYTWEMDPLGLPWKVRCPHCKELFPKNDFAAFHHSGLDEHGVFDPARADRSLLFNAEHPDPKDPLHAFGVDDGEGYIADGHTWRFIGAYLIYGQWKRHILMGTVHLADAYMVTGEPRYAYKAAILLDRAADIYPGFNFTQQGLVYETRENVRGQISTWHDACEEIRMLAQAYDQIFEGAKAQESALTTYLSAKAEKYRLPNAKQTWGDIQRNIEQGLFVDTLNHRERIESNYPRTDVSMLTLKTVLYWPQNRDEVLSLLDGIVNQATAVDGLSGEKGMAGYTTIAPRSLADLLALYARLEPGFLKTVYERHPVLHQTYRFHIDLKCLDEYYPMSGDSGSFAMKYPGYGGVDFANNPGVNPSMYSFLWDLYQLTQDPALVQTLYAANKSVVDGLPHELLAADPAQFQKQVAEVIARAGATIPLGSVNKEQWHIAVLRSGMGENRRALWFDYDAGGRHSHADGMNVGYFGKGLDLVPDFGYPPVGYGGWGSPKARWYTSNPAHATVTVDGKNQPATDGTVTLWADGDHVRAVRASAPTMSGGTRYERCLVMVDLDERDSYIVDSFQVVGGTDHAKFFHSGFGTVETQGLTLSPGPDYGFETQMRNFQRDPAPKPGWSADWTIDDHYHYLAPDRRIHMRYIDLTSDAEADLAEGWVETIQFDGEPTWIPRLMVRRQTSEAPLASTFVSVFAAYEKEPTVLAARRLPLEVPGGRALPDAYVGIAVDRRDGKRDVCLLPDTAGPVEVVEPINRIHFRGQMALLTLGDGPERIAVYGAEWITIGALDIRLKGTPDYVELEYRSGQIVVVKGAVGLIEKVTSDGRPLTVLDRQS